MNTQEIFVDEASAADAEAIRELLRDAGLPHEDFATHLKYFLVARSAGEVIGAIGAEVCGEEGLLRSLVVAPTRRGMGLGQRLADELERRAAGWGVKRWWLLTTTAEPFFAARGFSRTPREAAPPGIAVTAEFRGLCPSVAVCLSRAAG